MEKTKIEKVVENQTPLIPENHIDEDNLIEIESKPIMSNAELKKISRIKKIEKLIKNKIRRNKKRRGSNLKTKKWYIAASSIKKRIIWINTRFFKIKRCK